MAKKRVISIGSIQKPQKRKSVYNLQESIKEFQLGGPPRELSEDVDLTPAK